LLLLLTGCTPQPPEWLTNDTHADDRPLIPKRLNIVIQGFTGPSYQVKWDGDALIYRHNAHGFVSTPSSRDKPAGVQCVTIEPTRDQWAKFRKALYRADATSWDKRYLKKSVPGGTTWKARIIYPGQRIISEGVNEYPNRSDFRGFLKAVSRLAEGREFR
jgi:hypothetical protein